MNYVVTQDFIKTDITQEKMIPHIEYIKKLIEQGVIVVSGPFIDERRGGMFILDVDNMDNAKEYIEKDPAVKAGILKNDIRQYNLTFIRQNQ